MKLTYLTCPEPAAKPVIKPVKNDLLNAMLLSAAVFSVCVVAAAIYLGFKVVSHGNEVAIKIAHLPVILPLQLTGDQTAQAMQDGYYAWSKLIFSREATINLTGGK